jgi:hypothetical protein
MLAINYTSTLVSSTARCMSFISVAQPDRGQFAGDYVNFGGEKPQKEKEYPGCRTGELHSL